MKWLLLGLATIFFLIGALPIPYFQHSDGGTLKTLTDLGGFVAGAWALSAGVLTVFAAWSISEAERMSRRREVAAICRAEIKGFWANVEKRKVFDMLDESIKRLQKDFDDYGDSPTDVNHDDLRSYRTHLGNWLWLQTTNPANFGALPFELAQDVVDYYSRTRNVCGRLNWMNDQTFPYFQRGTVLSREKYAQTDLEELKTSFRILERRLDEIANPKSSTVGIWVMPRL